VRRPPPGAAAPLDQSRQPPSPDLVADAVGGRGSQGDRALIENVNGDLKNRRLTNDSPTFFRKMRRQLKDLLLALRMDVRPHLN
jgi:hypothetical protein